MAKAKTKKQEVEPTVEKVTYVCIRRCFDHGRVWLPIREAVRKKDYLLEVGADVKVSEKNFMKVDEIPDPEPPEEPEGVALSDVQTDEMLS